MNKRQSLIKAIGDEVASLNRRGVPLPPDLAALWDKYSAEYTPGQSDNSPERLSLAKSAETLAEEIRAARYSMTLPAQPSDAMIDRFTALIERFTETLNSLTQQAPPTILVTNEVKPAPVTVVQQHPRFSTEETTIKRGNNGEMLGSVTRVTHEYIDGS